MIVNIAAWLYIAQAVLVLGSLAIAPMGFAQGLLGVVFAGLFGALGYGLLNRLTWARWLALGSSLLGWTLGSLILLLLIAYLTTIAPLAMLLALFFGAGIFSLAGIIVVLALLVWVANIVISYKLFWHLWSEEGAVEFDAFPGSLQELGASVGAWVGLMIVNYMVVGGGEMGSLLRRGEPGGMTAASAAPRAADAESRSAEADYAARRARSEAMLRAQAELEAAQAEAQDEEEDEAGYEYEEDPEPEEVTEPESDLYAANQAVPANVGAAPEPASIAAQSAVEEESDQPSNKTILKCIDSAGGTIYTQGYCPPGSRPARAPGQ